MTYLNTALIHLDYLNDHAQVDYALGSESFIINANRYNVTLSPESVNTRSSDKKMKLRDITINNKKIRCEWHTKLSKTSGRIHFHHGLNLSSDISMTTLNRVIIGKFAKHLDT